MRRGLLTLLAVLGLCACGAGRESGPAGSTESSPVGSLPEVGSTESSPVEALPDLARVVCLATGPPRVETAAVRPRPDGVHIQVVNETGKDLVLAMSDSSRRGGGDRAPVGTATQVVDLVPGTVSIACFDAFNEDAGKVEKTALEIVDEDGVWTSTELTCARQFSSIDDYVGNAPGSADPLEAARERLDPLLQAGDIVEPAGYPETKERPSYRLVRAGNVLATVELERARAGGWLAGTLTGCASLLP